MFVELAILLRDQPVAPRADVLTSHAEHRLQTTADGIVVISTHDADRRTEFSFGTTSVYDDEEWRASVEATDPEGWQRAQPIVHQVDVNGRSLERADLAPAYAVAIELAARGNGMVWDAVAEQPVGDDPAAAAERCAAALDQAEAEYAASLPPKGFFARLLGR